MIFIFFDSAKYQLCFDVRFMSKEGGVIGVGGIERWGIKDSGAERIGV